MTEDTRILQSVRFPRHERHGLFMGLQWYQLSLVALGMLIAAISSASGVGPDSIGILPALGVERDPLSCAPGAASEGWHHGATGRTRQPETV